MKRFRGGIVLPALAVLGVLLVIGIAPAVAQEAGAPVVAFPISGTVGETFETTGIYTYVKVNTAGGASVWVVTQVCSVKQGDKIEIGAGQVYSQVYSDNVKLTFDTLVVATKVKINGVDMKALAAHDLPSSCTIRKPAK